tara:strand:- start:710 stop:1492 length:783 start_codon:yes stop_codon:yes gene_type:complete
MGVNYNPRTITDDCVFCLDMANPKCYPAGFGLKSGGMKDLTPNPVGTGNDLFFFTNSGSGPTFVNEGERSHFHFTRTEGNRISFENAASTPNHLLTKMGHSGSGTEALPFTIEFVIRIETQPTGAGGNGFGVIRFNGNAGIGCHIRNGNGAGVVNVGYTGQGNYSSYGSTVELGEWYYGAVTRNNAASGSGVLNYYDKTGLTKTQTGQNITTTFGTQNCLIGGSPGFMDGDIALIRVYKRDLTESEVRTNFESLRGRFGL